MEKRDAIDDIIDIVLPVPDPAPADADELTRAPLEAVREEVVRQMVENDHILKRYTTLTDRLCAMATLIPR